MSNPAEPGQTARFEALFDVYAPRIYAYARRHTEAAHVEDVVAETFLVAWRRLDQVPDEPLPWLLVVARNTLANQRRAFARHDRARIEAEALEHLARPEAAVDDVVIGRAAMLAALGSLTAVEREAVLLTAWDGLTDSAAATVAGCSARAFRVRLHRARRRIERSLQPDEVAFPLNLLLKETI